MFFKKDLLTRVDSFSLVVLCFNYQPNREHHTRKENIMAQFVKTITIHSNGLASQYHLFKIDGVSTWCYESGAIIANEDTLNLIRTFSQ